MLYGFNVFVCFFMLYDWLSDLTTTLMILVFVFSKRSSDCCIILLFQLVTKLFRTTRKSRRKKNPATIVLPVKEKISVKINVPAGDYKVEITVDNKAATFMRF